VDALLFDIVNMKEWQRPRQHGARRRRARARLCPGGPERKALAVNAI